MGYQTRFRAAKYKFTILDMTEEMTSDLEGRSKEHTDAARREKAIEKYKILL